RRPGWTGRGRARRRDRGQRRRAARARRLGPEPRGRIRLRPRLAGERAAARPARALRRAEPERVMSILQQIGARQRAEVAARRARHPIGDLERVVEPTPRRLGEALSRPGPRFILECKKASPSAGVLRPDFDAAAIADTYRDFADAISVLTDAGAFQGS